MYSIYFYLFIKKKYYKFDYKYNEHCTILTVCNITQYSNIKHLHFNAFQLKISFQMHQMYH